MGRSVFTVAESETSSVNERVLLAFAETLFIQAVETAIYSNFSDACHSLVINQKLLERPSPLSVVIIISVSVAPWMDERHIQQHLLHLWVQHSLQLLASLYLCHRGRSTTLSTTFSLHPLWQIVNNLYFAFEYK